MNSKRLRRPNVRLWEIGDLSAAFTCGISYASNSSLGQKKWRKSSCHFEKSEYLQIVRQKQTKDTILDPSVSPRVIEDIQHNRENKNPNSLKIVPEFANSDETNMINFKLDFGNITRRSRLMKRRRRNPNSTCSLFGDPWNLDIGHVVSSKHETSYGWYQTVGRTSDAGFSSYHINGFKDSSDNETSVMSKEARENEIDDPIFHMRMQQKPNEFSNEGTWFEENMTFPQSMCGHNKKVSRDGDVNSVTEWLEELGFGTFAKLFEMHEVDKETLSLLTFEDLKDMGIAAVGPRRKLFTAIQKLKGGM